MKILIHLLKFLAMAGLGFASIFAIIFGSLSLGIIDALPPDAYLYQFQLFYMGGSVFALIAGCLLGVVSFFVRGRASTIFLLMPLAVPFIYCVIVLTYFSTLPAPV